MKNKIFKAAILVSVMTIINKPLGFIRQAIIAAYYGVSSQTDAFFLAQNMPSLLLPAVCTALSTAFITIYVSKLIKDGEKEGNNFASSAIVFNLIVAGVLSLLIFIFSPFIVKVFAPGFDKETLLLATKLTRIVMSIFAFTMLQYMLDAVLKSNKFYIGSQITGILYNLIIISITLMIGNKFGVYGLTWTFVIGHIAQSILLIILSKKKLEFKFPKLGMNDDIKQMFKIAIPILIGNSVVQLNNIVDKMLASYLEKGAVSALSYSNTLNSFVITIIITSLSTVLYPTMADYISRDDKNNLINSISNSIIMLVLVLAPISIITSIYSRDVVSIAYGRGSFDINAIMLTSSALRFYGLGFVFIGIKEIGAKLFYAYKDTRAPLTNGVISVGLNIVFSIVLSRFMGIAGIALGTTISLFITTILYFISIKRKIPEISLNNFINTFIKIIIAGLIMAISIVVFKFISKDLSSLVRFSLVTVLGFIIYISLLYILRCNELIEIIKFIKGKMRSIRIRKRT